MERQITNNWIDRYNNGELNEEERAYFEENLNKNPELLLEQKLDSELDGFIADSELIDFMKQIANLPSKIKKKRNKFTKLRIAAAFWGMIILLLTMMNLFLRPVNHKNQGHTDQSIVKEQKKACSGMDISAFLKNIG